MNDEERKQMKIIISFNKVIQLIHNTHIAQTTHAHIAMHIQLTRTYSLHQLGQEKLKFEKKTTFFVKKCGFYYFIATVIVKKNTCTCSVETISNREQKMDLTPNQRSKIMFQIRSLGKKISFNTLNTLLILITHYQLGKMLQQ